jgi:hypothetical protein
MYQSSSLRDDRCLAGQRRRSFARHRAVGTAVARVSRVPEAVGKTRDVGESPTTPPARPFSWWRCGSPPRPSRVTPRVVGVLHNEPRHGGLTESHAMSSTRCLCFWDETVSGHGCGGGMSPRPPQGGGRGPDGVRRRSRSEPPRRWRAVRATPRGWPDRWTVAAAGGNSRRSATTYTHDA